MIALENFAETASAHRPKPQAQSAAQAAQAARRQRLAAEFRTATDWFTLCHRLRRIGVCLKLQDGILWLCDTASRRPLISCAALGFDPEDLELRFGPLQPRCRAAA